MINWENVRIGVTILENKIVVGKTKARQVNGDSWKWIDKSGDMTEQAVKAVMEHMFNICESESLKWTAFNTEVGDKKIELRLTMEV